MSLATLAAALVVLCGCGDPAPEELAVHAQAIVNGAPAEGDDSVVGLMSGMQIVCSGVLVSPRVVITAAHCLADEPHGRITQVFFGMGRHLGGETRDVETSAVHPRYARDTGAHDVGAVLLSEAAPAHIEPMAVRPGAFPELEPGMPVRLIGYGDTTGVDSRLATRRSGHTTISALDDSSFFHEATPSMACHGDSGGPALVSIGAEEVLVGIAVRGDEGCASFGQHTRIDGHWDDFLRHFPEPTAEAGQRCHFDTNCVSGTCVEPLVHGASRYCSEPCAGAGDCSPGMQCELDQAGDRLCRPTGREPGALGAACRDDTDCHSGFCAETAQGGVCSLHCFVDNELVCPDGYRCAPSGALGACLVDAVESKPGCSISAPAAGRSGNGSQAWVLGVALLILGFRRAFSSSSERKRSMGLRSGKGLPPRDGRLPCDPARWQALAGQRCTRGTGQRNSPV